VRTPRRRSLNQELESIRRSLTSIIRTIARLGPALEAAAGAPPPPGVRRPRRFSPKRRAALKLQGRYIGHVRKLTPKQRVRVRKLREAKGVGPAIRFAMKLARSKRA
jgi:hypothetical protein